MLIGVIADQQGQSPPTGTRYGRRVCPKPGTASKNMKSFMGKVKSGSVTEVDLAEMKEKLSSMPSAEALPVPPEGDGGEKQGHSGFSRCALSHRSRKCIVSR